jgi:23S rRNA (cytosine1962-C5)-methyltransferase
MMHGHDWVYGSEVLKVFGDPVPGSVIALKDGRDRPLGTAIYNPRSQIVARRISRRKEQLDGDFFRRRVARALAWREQAGCNPALSRLVWGEADGLPGVVADRYGPAIVLQTNTLAMDLHKADLALALADIEGVACVIEKNDSGSRVAEGLEPAVGVLWGEDPGSLVVEAAGVRFELDLSSGQKTGLYLDQVENWRILAGYAQGCSVLDCFANQGGFALACAVGGATSVMAVESGAAVAARLEHNARLNGCAIELVQADVFGLLDRLAREERRFDIIILDPPSFTKVKGRIHDALRGYRDLHRRAAPLLAPGGLLATFCCSHHVSKAAFREAVAAGMGDAKRAAHILAELSQPVDHPVALHMPETDYLKGLLLAARSAF